MLGRRILLCATFLSSIGFNSAFGASSDEIKALRAEFENIKSSYEKRISDLERKLAKKEQSKQQIDNSKPSNSIASTTRSNSNKILNNSFNPSIGVILNGKYSAFSKGTSEIAGFGVGHEGERGREGFAITETELNFASNIDDKFYGSLTAAIVREDGEDKIELEEAFVQTTPGFGLPTGLELKAGRAFWNLGYLNEHHSHSDDFADRPLPYRVFLNKSFNDDGGQISYVLPTDFYAEIGGGSFRGDDFPLGNGDGTGSYSAYFRVGGDISDNQNLRLGAYMLSGETKGEGRKSNENTVAFIGESDLYIADLRYNFAPNGNSKNQEFSLQGEYFYRDENGTYSDSGAATGNVNFKNHSSGWYGQMVYKFKPQWRVGLRYSQLFAANVPAGLVGSAIDADGHNPKSYSTMVDWTNSEFGRIRLQYNHEELSKNRHDNQIMLQYIMSFGAHMAHKY